MNEMGKMTSDTETQSLAMCVYLAHREMISAFYSKDQPEFSRAGAEYNRLTRGYSKTQIYALLNIAKKPKE